MVSMGARESLQSFDPARRPGEQKAEEEVRAPAASWYRHKANEERKKSPSQNRPRVGVWLRSDSLILLQCFSREWRVEKGREEEVREKTQPVLQLNFRIFSLFSCNSLKVIFRSRPLLP